MEKEKKSKILKIDSKRMFVLIFLCITSLTMMAQMNNYKSGYILTNERDTVFGWIDLRTDESNGKVCRFKIEADQKETVYHPGEIAGYRFSDKGKYFVSRDVDIDSISRKVFLEYLVQGIMDLYYYSDGQQDYFFFENQEGKMNLVTRKPVKIEDDKVVLDTKYKGLIAYIFRDYQPIAKGAEKLKFDQHSFINIAKKYHEKVCTTGEDCIVFENQHPDNIPIEISLSAYTGINSFTYNHYTDVKYIKETDRSPMIGLGVNLKNPRWTQSWSLQFDIFASKHEGKTDEYLFSTGWYSGSNPYELEPVLEKVVYAYKSDLLFCSFGVKYEYPKYKLRPVAELGFSHALFLNLKATMDIDAVKKNNSFISSVYGFYAGLGCDYKLNKKQTILFRINATHDSMNASEYLTNDYLSHIDIKLGYAYTF